MIHAEQDYTGEDQYRRDDAIQQREPVEMLAGRHNSTLKLTAGPPDDVETKTGDFDPAEFVDEYENAVVELIKQKQAGKPISKKTAKVPSAESGNIIDLLKRSMELEDKRGKKVKAPSLAPALPKGKSKQRAKAS